MTTPIDRESVGRWECSACPRTMDPEMVADPLGDWVRYEDFRAALDAADGEIARLRGVMHTVKGGPVKGELLENWIKAQMVSARSALQENHHG